MLTEMADALPIIAILVLVVAFIRLPWRSGQKRNVQAPANVGLESDILDIQNRRRRKRASLLDAAPRESAYPRNGNSSELIAAVVAAHAVRLDGAFNEQDPSTASEPSSPKTTREVRAASKRPIVFKRLLETTADQSLSHFGGKPKGPATLEWPCIGGKERNQPLHFLMQWDCAQLVEQDSTGLLPKDGALYCFLDLEWGNPEGFYFVHQAGPTGDWKDIEPPANIGPIFGSEGAWLVPGCLPKIENASDYVPRFLPHFSFEPIAFDYPFVEGDCDEDGEFWSEERPVAEQLLKVQYPGDQERQVENIEKPAVPFERPFATFPHDFGSLRIIAAKAVGQLSRISARAIERAFPDFSKEDKAALKDAWRDEANELYKFAVSQPSSTRLKQDLSDKYWSWVEEHFLVMGTGFGDLVEDTIDLSLGLSSDGLDHIPSDWIERVFVKKHSLAREYMRWEYPDHSIENAYEVHEQKKKDGLLDLIHEIHAPSPAHMFGPPSHVQGDVADLMDEYVLLLELPSGGAPGLEIGEGVLQYMIKPQDLAEGRFDKVRQIITAY